jgi:hypothetical protein
MINLALTTLIGRPVRQVFDFISTSENDVQWQHGALASFQISGNPIGVGTLFSSMGHFMGRRVWSNFEVTEYEPDKRYGFKSSSSHIQLQTLYTFEAVQDGTLVSATTKVSQNGYFKLPDIIVAKYAKSRFKENLVKLKDLLEVR